MRSDQLSKILSTVQIMGFKKQFYHFNLIYIYWFDSAGLPGDHGRHWQHERLRRLGLGRGLQCLAS